MPFDAYTLYYVAQALYQVGGERWEKYYPDLRDSIVAKQRGSGEEHAGSWEDGKRIQGTPGRLFGTSVAVFTLTIPNRYLPILQAAPEDEEASAQAEPRRID